MSQLAGGQSFVALSSWPDTGKEYIVASQFCAILCLCTLSMGFMMQQADLLYESHLTRRKEPVPVPIMRPKLHEKILVKLSFLSHPRIIPKSSTVML